MSEETTTESTENLAQTTETHSNVNSFDEIEEMTLNKSAEDLVKEAQKHVKKESKEQSRSESKSEGKNQDVDRTAHAKEASETSKSSEKSIQDDSAELNEAETEELIEEIKMLNAKRGDKEYELPLDAKIPTKIDGEEVEVTLEELRNNYSGKQAWDKKFTELSKDKAEFTEQKQAIENYVNHFRALAEEKNYSGALEFLAELAGQNPLQFRRSLRDNFYQQFKELQEMTPEQIDAFEIQEENEFLRKQNESEKQRLSSQQSQIELERQVAAFQETHKVSQDQMLELYESVANDLKMKGENRLPELRDIESKLNNQRAFESAGQILGKVDRSLVENEAVMQEAASIYNKYKGEWNEDDFIEVFSEAFKPANKTKKVSKKAKTASKQASDSNAPAVEKTFNGATSFDELEEF